MTPVDSRSWHCPSGYVEGRPGVLGDVCPGAFPVGWPAGHVVVAPATAAPPATGTATAMPAATTTPADHRRTEGLICTPTCSDPFPGSTDRHRRGGSDGGKPSHGSAPAPTPSVHGPVPPGHLPPTDWPAWPLPVVVPGPPW